MRYKIGFQNEIFDLFFGAAVAQLSESERQALPVDVYRSLFGRGKVKPLWRIPFTHKWYVLFRSLNMRLFIVAEDEKEGHGIEDFLKFKEAEKEKSFAIGSPGQQMAHFSFFAGNKELGDWLAYLNAIGQSPAYSYALKLKNEKVKSFPALKNELNYLMDMFANLEVSKPKILRDFNITSTELNILMYLYSGKSASPITFYGEVFKNSFGCSKRSIVDAVSKLEAGMYLARSGEKRDTKLKIAPYGITVMNEVIKKYLIQ